MLLLNASPPYHQSVKRACFLHHMRTHVVSLPQVRSFVYAWLISQAIAAVITSPLLEAAVVVYYIVISPLLPSLLPAWLVRRVMPPLAVRATITAEVARKLHTRTPTYCCSSMCSRGVELQPSRPASSTICTSKGEQPVRPSHLTLRLSFTTSETLRRCFCTGALRSAVLSTPAESPSSQMSLLGERNVPLLLYSSTGEELGACAKKTSLFYSGRTPLSLTVQLRTLTRSGS